MSHEREIPHYEGDIQGLAQAVGRLTYDRLADFLLALSDELNEQGEADQARGRPKLSKTLLEAGTKMEGAESDIREAWRISKPHMTPKERGEDE